MIRSPKPLSLDPYFLGIFTEEECGDTNCACGLTIGDIASKDRSNGGMRLSRRMIPKRKQDPEKLYFISGRDNSNGRLGFSAAKSVAMELRGRGFRTLVTVGLMDTEWECPSENYNPMFVKVGKNVVIDPRAKFDFVIYLGTDCNLDKDHKYVHVPEPLPNEEPLDFWKRILKEANEYGKVWGVYVHCFGLDYQLGSKYPLPIGASLKAIVDNGAEF